MIYFDDSSPVVPLTIPTDTNWLHEDSFENYQKSIKNNPSDWIYRTQKVEYHWNTLGYRTPEFGTVDWESSILLFGDSQMVGVGLDETQTIRYQLSKLTKLNVVSLAASGSSGLFQWVNGSKLKKWLNNLKPKAVIVMWPTWERYFIVNETSVNHISAQSFTRLKGKEHAVEWLSEPNIGFYNLPARLSFLETWKDSFIIESKTKINDLWPVENRVSDFYYDRARDNKHLGPVWTREQSLHWTEKLKENKVI